MADPREKFKNLVSVTGIFGPLFTATNDPAILLPANNKYFDILQEMCHILINNELLLTHYGQNLQKNFSTEINTPEDLKIYAYNKLRQVVENFGIEDMDCDNGDSTSKLKYIASAYVKLAYFTKDRSDEKFQGDFMLYVLRGMKLNSLEAKQLFPCIIIQKQLGSDFVQLFIEEAEKIPTWMFLGWIPQLLANLDSGKIHALSKIIIRIAETYPQAILYPYRLSKEHYHYEDIEISGELRSLTDKLDELLLQDVMVDKFLKALSFVSIPIVTLRYFITKMYKSQNENDVKAIQENVLSFLFKEMPNTRNPDNMQGNMFKSITKYKRDMEKILTVKKMKEELAKIDGQLKVILDKQKSFSTLLKDYCPWLANFSANRMSVDLEIPGQYSGDKLPLPQHHIKISSFHPNVTVMESLRKPIKLTIIGFDTKEYPFLIKFGEDIRQDQRIEQLFGLMNDIFKSDTTCNFTNLEILTYQVIPLTSSLGMIQWVKDTQPLNYFLKKSLSDKESLTFDNIGQDYEKWLCTARSYVMSYGLSAVRYNRNKVIPHFRGLVNRIPWNILRKSFLSLSSTTESYIALRNNFIKSYAVLCVSHWILGIGDRHLGNSLICTRNGKVLGIDFGHAFGTGTQILPIPELVPFRLTPHIVSLMEPLKERGQFRQSMIHSLRVLRANYNSLLATMQVFIGEPSLDWLEHASKLENSEEGKNSWYPKVKVDQTKRKLQGESSTKIVEEDLKANRIEPQFIEAYVKLVRGAQEFDKRTRFVGSDLSVEDQVDCLLDHATDDNLLGRMWKGWMPWI